MNTILWLIAMIASLWLAVYSFGTLGEAALGYVGIGLFLFCFVMTIASVWEDVRTLSGKHSEGEE